MTTTVASHDDATTSSSLLTTMVLAGGVAALAASQLNITGLYDAFLDLENNERMAMAGLVFSIMVLCITAVQFSSLMNNSNNNASSKTSNQDLPKQGQDRSSSSKYPLAEIAAAETDKDKFLVLFPHLKREILAYLQDEHELLDEAVTYLDRMMDYSVPGGKLNRGTTVIAVVRTLAGGRPLTDMETAQAAVLGWCIEFLQAFFLVADDVMDESKTRRGQPCWYKLPEIGMVAINDSFLLESFCFLILKLHFGDHPAYGKLLDLLLLVTQKTEVGQLYDLTSQPQTTKNGAKAIDLDRFTMTRYSQIVKYKTAFYSFYLPVAMGMRLAGLNDDNGNHAYPLAMDICVEMGEYFQIQDDYLDCFGDPKIIGKVGTDIQDNKCSWLVVQALKLANEKQINVLKSNYGQWNDGKVDKVKKLYRELDLPKVYETYEDEFYRSIQAKLAKVDAMPKEVFEIFLTKIYKRSK